MTADETRACVDARVTHYRVSDVDALVNDHVSDGTVETPSVGRHQGRAAIDTAYRRWLVSFPDMEFTLDEVLVSEDAATVVFHAHGTHRGEFLGLAATGKTLEFQGVLVQKFEDGLIRHELRMFDFTEILIRLGVLKVKPA